MFIQCKTDKGMVRNNNEDYVLNFSTKKYDLFIVADGMGGHNGGEIASKLAAVTVREFIYEQYGVYENKEELIRDGILKANAAVFEKQAESSELKGMGTTVTCCLLELPQKQLYFGHVGDSRAYLIHSTGIEMITKDHSYVQELVRNGTITEEEARTHPQRNLIMRAVGTEDVIEVDTGSMQLKTVDILLICSDGLTLYVEDDELLSVVAARKEESAEALVQLANERGGNDNISIIIAGMEDS